MTREIKFRAWHIDLEDMTFSEEDGLHFFSKCFVSYPAFYKVMQFTGLKDKNGKEIYEGDIANSEKMENGIIEYHPGLAMFVILFEEIGQYKAIYLYEDELEVIGNIYENRELIKS